MPNITEIRQNRKPIVFLGSCLSLPNIIESCEASEREVLGVIDDDYSSQTHIQGLPRLSSDAVFDADTRANCEFFVATTWNPGRQSSIKRNNQKRDKLIALVESNGLQGATIVHPSAIVSPLAHIGTNVRIGAMTMVTARASIGNHTNIKEQCYISHDTVVGQDCVIQLKATITGHVHIGSKVYVGINATIINRWSTWQTRPMNIGDRALIHPSVTVMQELPPDAVAAINSEKFSRIF